MQIFIVGKISSLKSSFPNKLAGTVKTETFCSMLSFTEIHECKIQQTEYCVGDKVVFAEQKCNFQLLQLYTTKTTQCSNHSEVILTEYYEEKSQTHQHP